MHLGLDLVFLVPGETGGRETYARELSAALRAARSGLRMTAFVNRETAAAGPGFWSEHADRVVVLPRASGRAPARWALGEVEGVARAARRAGVDVLHSPANFAPLHGRFARVVTVHDLLWRQRPEAVGRVARWGTELLVPAAARRAHRVITPAAAGRDDLAAELGVPPERIDVIPNGAAPPGRGDGAAARARLGAGERPVVLAVATDLPHKNLGALVAALARIPPGRRPLLAVAGHGTDGGALGEQARAVGVEDDVRLLGALSPDQLEDAYAAADGLATATRWEGFGLPVLEAMARGVPVACSDLPALREVAGDAARYFGPDDTAAVADALAELAAGGPDVEERRAHGLERAPRFTWGAAAEATLASYERALEARSTTTKTLLV